MQPMWPELLSAMSVGMGPMMRFFGKTPGALAIMKPMFPVLFPILLPKRMPKVMRTMLDRIEQIVHASMGYRVVAGLATLYSRRDVELEPNIINLAISNSVAPLIGASSTKCDHSFTPSPPFTGGEGD